MSESKPETWVLEDDPDGPTFVVTDFWSASTAEAFLASGADGLNLNYARGFKERDLSFLADLPIRRLYVLSRTLKDVGPIYELRNLQHLTIDSGAKSIDLDRLLDLASVGAEWSVLRSTIDRANLKRLSTWGYSEVTLEPLQHMRDLEKVVLKQADSLGSLQGLTEMKRLTELHIGIARDLSDLTEVADTSARMLRLDFETCRSISDLEPISAAVSLEYLGVNDCADIASIQPLRPLQNLERFHAWESTRVQDGDLTPLLTLPRLAEIRMMDRQHYRPRVAEIQTNLATPLTSKAST